MHSCISGKIPSGKPAWHVAWYVDGLLAPVIKMKRGTTYIINVFGGNDPTELENYHPFYLTSSPTGGYKQLSEEEKRVCDAKIDSPGWIPPYIVRIPTCATGCHPPPPALRIILSDFPSHFYGDQGWHIS